jgi:YVTN family beta-propeller protein
MLASKLSLAFLAIMIAAMIFFSLPLSAPSAYAEMVTATIHIPVGNNPAAVAYDSGMGEVFVANQGSGKAVSVISDSTNTVVATVTVGSAPTGVAYDSGKGEVFVTNEGSATVSVISDSTNTVVATISSIFIPIGVAYDSGKGEIFVASGDCVSSVCIVYVISDSTNAVVATVPVGSSAPQYLAYDSAKGEVFATNFSAGKVSVISDSSNTVVATITVGSDPAGVAYDAGKGEIFVANQNSGTVSVISDSSNTVVATITVGGQPYGVAYDSGTSEIFVTEATYDVFVISDGTNTVVTTIGTQSIGFAPTEDAYDPSKREMFVTLNNANSVIVISDPTLTLTPNSGPTGSSTTLSGSNYRSPLVPPVDLESCAIYSGYVYCVGGNNGGNTGPMPTSGVYYAQISSGGVVGSSWAPTTSYPTSVYGESCAIYSGYIYCVGGWMGVGYASTVYYAPVSSSGVGSWTSTTAYPTGVYGESCAIYSGYIYCVGGYTGSSYISTVYYAPVSSSGVGSWTSTTAYPTSIYLQSCAIYSGYIYCATGYTGSSYTNAVYYAQVSSGGLGSWTSSTAYPASFDRVSCTPYSGYIYCVGGYTGSSYTNAVYYSPVSSSGVGAWTSTTAYPTNIRSQSCALDSSTGHIYCIAGDTGNGFTNAVYYVQASSGGVGSWISTTAYPTNAYNYCFESGVTSSPTACSSTYQFTANSAGNIPASTTLTVSGSTGLVVVSDPVTGAIISSALFTVTIPQFTMTVSYQIIGGGSPTPPTFTYVTHGVTTTYTLTTSPTGISVDQGTSWSVAPNTGTLTGSTSSERWQSSPSQALSGTTSTTTIVFTFYHQFLQTLSYSVVGGGSPTGPTFTAGRFGSSFGQSLTTSATGYWFDAGASWTVSPNPLAGSSATERWYSNQALTGTASSAQTLNFTFYHQFLQTLSYGIGGSPAGSPTAPTFTSNRFGSSFPQTLTASPTGYWFDNGASWNVSPNPLVGSSSSERWYSSQALTGTVSSAQALVFTFYHQFYLTMQVSPSSKMVTLSPGSSWQNAGSTVPIQATSSISFVFSSWSGSGSGSYTGRNNPATIMMGGPITEVANFAGAPSGFDFFLSQGSQNVIVKEQGASGSIAITVVGIRGSLSVSLSCGGLPSFASCSFNPGSTNTPFVSILIIATSSSTPKGSYTITVTGTSGGVMHTTQFTLVVQ